MKVIGISRLEAGRRYRAVAVTGIVLLALGILLWLAVIPFPDMDPVLYDWVSCAAVGAFIVSLAVFIVLLAAGSDHLKLLNIISWPDRHILQ